MRRAPPYFLALVSSAPTLLPQVRARPALMLWRLAWMLLALGALWGQPPMASAAPESASRLEVIRRQMEKGQGLFSAGKHREAAEVFEAGFDEYPYSAFLFNAAVCHEKAGDLERAIGTLKRYLEVDPEAPDAEDVQERLERLREAVSAQEADSEETGTAPDRPAQSMKSLVVIETTPSEAPVRLYRRVDDAAQPFAPGKENEGWKLVAERKAPVSLTLDVGRYHVVVEKFREFNQSEADIVVSPGHVHHFQANLSQGAFMAFLRVTANVPGAYVFVDDPKGKQAPWGRAPHGELIAPGEHELLVEAPGYRPHREKVDLVASDQREIVVTLERLEYGIVRVDANVPEAWIAINGRPLGLWKQGEAPLEAQLPAGEHTLTVTADGHKTLRTPFEVPPGQVLPLRAHMIPTYPRGTAWTQAAIATVLLGAGTYLGVESNRLHGELRADRDAGHLDPSDPRIARGRWFAIGANGGFAVGGLFALLSTYNFLKDPYPDSAVQRGKRREFEDQRVGPAAFAPRSVPWQTIATGVQFDGEAF